MLDQSGAAALLDWERMRQLLGQEPTPDILSQIGGAIGARYVINVSATALPNGTIYMQVVVMDTTTGRAVVRKDTPPTDSANIPSKIDTLTSDILKDMAGLLGGVCDEHWTGTINFLYKYEESPAGAGKDGITPANAKVNVTTMFQTKSAMDNVLVSLRPLTLGAERADRPKARITRHFEYKFNNRSDQKTEVRCRPRGANSYIRTTNAYSTEQMNESGDATSNTVVYINLSGNKYEIKAQVPELVTKWQMETVQQIPGGCEDPPPVKASSNGTNSVFASGYKVAAIDIRGEFDPKHPDVLTGELRNGNADVGVTTITWNLKRVRPKSRNER